MTFDMSRYTWTAEADALVAQRNALAAQIKALLTELGVLDARLEDEWGPAERATTARLTYEAAEGPISDERWTRVLRSICEVET